LKILFAVTGSVAAFEAIRLIRDLSKAENEVYVVASRQALRYVTAEILKWASGRNEVYTELEENAFHVTLSNMCDIMVIYPATANTISKIANGIADTPVTLTAISFVSTGKPLIIFPAMCLKLYESPFFRRNLEKLKSIENIRIVGPVIEDNIAKVVKPAKALKLILSFSPLKKAHKGLKVLVTAGPTRTYIDKIRYLTNPSSGKMGVYIAEELYMRGADVKLVLGKGSVKPLPDIPFMEVETTGEMLEKVLEELGKEPYNLVILAAAPMDFAVATVSPSKLKSDRSYELKLQPYPKIYSAIVKNFPRVNVICFKADIIKDKFSFIDRMTDFVKRNKLLFVVANDISTPEKVFGSESSKVMIIDENGLITETGYIPKRQIAEVVVDIALKKLGF